MNASKPPAGRTGLTARLAGMTVAAIDALSDREVAELMGATPEQIATEPPWTWRVAARVATDEYADRLLHDVDAGRVSVERDPAAARRRLGGRPALGGQQGSGPSQHVRVRVTGRTRAALEAIAAAQGRRLSDVGRDALDEYIERHAG